MKHRLTLPVTENIFFVQPTIQVAEELFNLVDSDRAHLEEFLDFVKMTKTIEDETNFLKMKITGEAEGTDRLFLIYYQDQLAGTIDLHMIDQKNKRAEIGYWIHSSFAGKGIMTQAVHKITEIGFDDLGLNKLSIIAVAENIASNKVAQKSGYEFVATLKEEQLLYGEFRDINRYALLKKEFVAKK